MKVFCTWMILGASLLWSVPSHAFFGFTQTKKKKPKYFVVEMTLKGAYPDKTQEAGLFSEKKSYDRLLRRIRRIRKDRRVHTVIFRMGGLAVGFAKADGIRRAIESLHKAGKRTIAVLQSSATPDYLAAIGCQRIVMTPAGMLYIPGVRAEQLYFKDLFQKIGVQADFVTVGAFKTAPEPFVRNSMSDAQKKQLGRLLGDLYAYMLERIATSRKLDKNALKATINRALLLPKDAKKSGLIDEVSYLVDLRKKLKKSIPLRPLHFVQGYGKIKRKRPTSIWSLFSWFFKRKPSKINPTKPTIAVIYASGSIQYGSSPGGWSNQSSTGIYSDDFIATLRKVQKIKNLRAVVLRINSPGGSALASDLIWRKLEQIKKRVPLFVSMGNVAASGGYYMAMGADAIVAQPTTITGSIGVFGGKIVLRGTMKKLGVSVQSVSLGKHSGIFSMYSIFSPSERAALQTSMNRIYSIFTTKAAKGRKMKLPALLKLAGGQVWTGRQALKNGLVDKLGSLDDTIRMAVQRTGLKIKPQIVRYPRPKSFFETLTKVSSAQGSPSTPYAVVRWFQHAMKIAPQHAEQLRPLVSTPMPVLMWSPIPKIILR